MEICHYDSMFQTLTAAPTERVFSLHFESSVFFFARCMGYYISTASQVGQNLGVENKLNLEINLNLKSHFCAHTSVQKHLHGSNRGVIPAKVLSAL